MKSQLVFLVLLAIMAIAVVIAPTDVLAGETWTVTVNPVVIKESADNNGSLSMINVVDPMGQEHQCTVAIYFDGVLFKGMPGDQDFRVNNLPPGYFCKVTGWGTKNDISNIYIGIYGSATLHRQCDSVENLNFVFSKNIIDGADQDLQTPNIWIEFNDGGISTDFVAEQPHTLENPAVIVDGELLKTDVQSMVVNGRTLVPFRALFEALGARVSWNESEQSVTAVSSDKVIKLIIGGLAYINGQEAAIDFPAQLVNGRTMVPVRFVAESMGFEVNWDESTFTVEIKRHQSRNR